ncbi:type I DNA topoisomerase [Mycoplasmopsis felis]|uniref:DNA topoisomerase 1 n=2 Tax=Mycoplasmopsis felis TaxID=33923 RepID=A0A809SK29_9BACT|nr:type I DNA topoisomerase [Mycoplasmopsis felis]BBU47516.1 DNA topoisomerase 1 [Mycoplasmopsis felis]
MKNLVIVESPNKVKTIQKYLGDDFQVVASVGHFLKMKTDGEFGLGIDFEKWEPKYSLDSSKRKLVTEIKSLIKESEHIYIATDPDREGEAIGSHLVNYFKIEDKYSRIKYNEITKDAILKSFNNATKLDFGLIAAQQSRRMLDRIIGFRVTNLIKTKFKNSPGLPTAGRVQSIALKLVVDREKEINAFIPQQYFKLSAKLKDNPTLAYYFNPENESEYNDWIFTNEIYKVKTDIENAQKILNVIDINVSNRKVSAKTPFKQSILYKKSPFSASSTQIIIQKLYEGYGESGLISYPRTDSTRLSQTFIDQAHSYIKNKWGQDYIASEIKGFSGDQDAHEAIRPTDISLTPERARTIYPEMTDQEYKVYKLIYENTLQSLIKQPIRQSKQYTFNNGEYKFRQSFSKVIYDGYYVVTGFDEEFLDPNYELNQIVDVEEFNFEDHETKPAPRYNDGTLIEMLDTIKVGRPSTFASTVNIIKERAFVERNLPVLKPTEFGMIINDYLINTFPDIFNEKYTAEVESQLDKIAEHEINKNLIMQNFWDNFTEVVKNASSKLEVVQFELTEIEKPCPNDQGILLIRNNKRGQKFIGCKNFPKCKYTESLVSE